MAMLRESSTITAMMFCCGLSSDTVIAGSHSKTRMSAASSACKPQITHARQLWMTGAACPRRERISRARPTAAATISSTSIHLGHAPRRANCPRAYTERGYLKKNSNMNWWAARGNASVGHRVRNVVQHDSKSQPGKLLGIFGLIGMLPGVAEMHVVADGNHDAPV